MREWVYRVRSDLVAKARRVGGGGGVQRHAFREGCAGRMRHGGVIIGRRRVMRKRVRVCRGGGAVRRRAVSEGLCVCRGGGVMGRRAVSERTCVCRGGGAVRRAVSEGVCVCRGSGVVGRRAVSERVCVCRGSGVMGRRAVSERLAVLILEVAGIIGSGRGDSS